MAKTKLNHFKMAAFLVVFFALTIAFLVGSLRAVDLVESQIIFASNQIDPSPIANFGQVAGISKKNIVEIIDSKLTPPKFSATGVLAQDINLNKTLYSKNADERMAPASTTKIMTALVAMEYYKSADVLTIPPEAMVGGSAMGLYPGEIMTFRSLLYGMLLNSGNDAAFAIAQNYPGGISAFVEKMNEKARSFNLVNTNFTNPAGFDNLNHYSSANDLAFIAKIAIADPYFARIVSTKETSVTSYDKAKTHELKNLNQLLGEKGVLGIKTGYTLNAGESLVALIERDGHKILTIILNSQDRFGESRSLINWVYSNFAWQ